MFIIIIIKECLNLEIIDNKWSRPIEEIYLFVHEISYLGPVVL